MNKDYRKFGFAELQEQEALYVIGGIDKEVQQVLYLIGCAIGVVCKFISKVFSKIF